MILPVIAALAIIGFIAASSRSSGEPGTNGLPSGPPKDADQEAFDALVAAAIAKGDVAQLEALAKQAEARGALEAARSIRAEIARLTGASQKETAPGPDKPAGTTDKTTPAGRPTLKEGSRGVDVAEWQRIVGATPDGIFGAATTAKTKAWQASRGLIADGIVGPKSWAEAYRTTPGVSNALPPLQSIDPAISAVPIAISNPGTPAAKVRPTIKLNSRGSDVSDWQRNLGGTPDGIFGTKTQAATILWQRAHGLTPDGIVGPATWATMGQPATVAVPGVPSLPSPKPTPVSYTPTPQTPTATPRRTLQFGYTGQDVALWQSVVGVRTDGIFGSGTRDATKRWQSARGIYADGIVGPKTWAAYDAGTPAAAIVPTVTPSVQPKPSLSSSDADNAASELTNYLIGLGGLAGRGKENRTTIAAYSKRLGVYDAAGMYGRGMAKAVMQHGIVPVVPYYWPKTAAEIKTAKAEFTALVNTYKTGDPQRATQWARLASDVQRA